MPEPEPDYEYDPEPDTVEEEDGNDAEGGEACTPLSDVVAAQKLTTLGAVVQAVSANDPDLGSTLEAALGSESGDLTVFGPTDEGNALTIARAARSPPAPSIF